LHQGVSFESIEAGVSSESAVYPVVLAPASGGLD